MPTPAQQAAGFVKTAVAVAADGFATLSTQDRIRRTDTCTPCVKFIPSHRRCAACGCFVDIKAKFRASVCPLGKW